MINWIRQASKPLLWLIVVIVVVSFAFWGDFTPTGNVAQNTVGVIDGKPVDSKTFGSALREAQLSYFLREGRLAQGPESERLVGNQAWQRLLLLHTADKMKVFVTAQELEHVITTLPIFLSEGVFNPLKFNNFRQGTLPAIGISYREFEDMLKNELRIQRTIELLTAGVIVDEKILNDQLVENFGINSVESIEFAAENFINQVKISDEDLLQLYETNRSLLRSPETRTFLLVKFPFDPLNEMEKMDAKERAVDFTISLLDEKNQPVADFSSAAIKLGLQVRELGPVTAEGDPSNQELLDILDVGFRLTKDSPDSNVIEGKDAYYVIRLKDISGRDQLTLEQAREQLKQQYIRQQSLSAAFVKAREIRDKVVAAMGEGKSFREAVSAEGLEVREIPRLVLSEVMDSQDFDQIRMANSVVNIPVGEVSQPQSFGDTVKLIFVKERQSPEEPESLRNIIRERLYEQARNQVLSEWLAHTLRGNTRLNITL